MRIGLLIHKQTHNCTRQHGMKLGIKFVNKEHITTHQRLKDRSRQFDYLVCSVRFLIVCTESCLTNNRPISTVNMVCSYHFHHLIITNWLLNHKRETRQLLRYLFQNLSFLHLNIGKSQIKLLEKLHRIITTLKVFLQHLERNMPISILVKSRDDIAALHVLDELLRCLTVQLCHK